MDDVSLDSSLEILEYFAKKDSELKSLNELNKDLGPTRNSGIDASEGKYILFLDGDESIVLIH